MTDLIMSVMLILMSIGEISLMNVSHAALWVGDEDQDHQMHWGYHHLCPLQCSLLHCDHWFLTLPIPDQNPRSHDGGYQIHPI